MESLPRSQRDQLLTKEDLRSFERNSRVQTEGFGADMAELRQDIADFRAEIADFRASFEATLAKQTRLVMTTLTAFVLSNGAAMFVVVSV